MATRPAATAQGRPRDEGRPLFQLVLAAQVGLAVLLLGLGRSARLVAIRHPSMAAVGRPAPALLRGSFYVLVSGGVGVLVATIVSSLLSVG